MRRIVLLVTAVLLPALAGAVVTEFHAGASALEVKVPVTGLLGFFAEDQTLEAVAFDAELDWNEAGDKPVALSVVIPVSGLRVKTPKMDLEQRVKLRKAMTSAKVLDIVQFPQISFTSTAIEVVNSTLWVVRGILTVRDQSQSIEIFTGIEPGNDGRMRARGAVELTLADYGIVPARVMGGLWRTGDRVEVRFDFIGNLVAPASADQPTSAD